MTQSCAYDFYPIVYGYDNFECVKYRSTIVHSNTVPPKEQQNYAFLKDQKNAEEAYRNSRDSEAVHVNLSRTMQTPQRISLGTLDNLLEFAAIPFVSYFST